MKTIAFMAQKGGVGKSTLAIHVAVAAEADKKNVLLVDLDLHSKTAYEWALERKYSTPVVVEASLSEAKQLISQAENEGFDLVIFDCPPYFDDVVKEITKIVDLVVIPSQPEFGPIRAIGRIMDEIPGDFSIVLNLCQHGLNGCESAKTKEARELLENSSVSVAPVSITRRVALTDALNGGDSVFEFESQGKAAKEIKKLYEFLIKEATKNG